MWFCKLSTYWRLSVEFNWSPRWWQLGASISLDSYYIGLLPLSILIYRLVELDDDAS